jgi:hypothetical protein
MGSYWQAGTGSRNYYSGNLSLWHLYTPPPKLAVGSVSVVYPKTVEQLRQELITSFNDDNEVDSLLNLLEADQLVSGVQSLSGFIHRFLDPRVGLNAKRARKGKASNLNPLDASNLLLGWSFGFAPLISDLQRIAKAIPSIRGKLRALAKQAQAPKTVTRSCVGTFEFSHAAGVNGYGPEAPDYPVGWWHERLTPVSAPIRVVGVKGRRTLQYVTEEFQVLDYLLSRFVATSPARLAWEKVPFSFVLDWFVDLTGLITAIDNCVVGQGKYEILRSWESESYELFVSVVKHPHAQFAAHTSFDGQDIAQHNISYYRRSPMKPDLVIVPSSRFGKKQAALSVALLHQQVASLTRRLRARR